ncbi:membrane protein [Ignisphaera aggregans DSM 17230]|uniref:Membrane protein n=1 Tax=Ignisphaera aggregans (strain DSM 17230 / JCM 13409 / AQ1.S1) TaxID=583356 RepID=E0SP79_IGNAA|nr:membrane protein [Ignisphaera aggregans DSM 17230]
MNSKITMALYIIIPLIFFATVSTFVPPNWTFVVFLLYTIVFLSIASIIPQLRARKKASEAGGNVILRSNEQEVLKLITKDTQLSDEIKSQLTSTMILFIAPFIIWYIVSITIYPILIPQNSGNIDLMQRFLRNLIFYGILMGIFQGLRMVTMPKKMIIAITKYEIRNVGLKLGSIFIPFPIDLKRYSISVDHKRCFVEIFDRSSRQAFRLYATDPQKIISIIERYGMSK